MQPSYRIPAPLVAHRRRSLQCCMYAYLSCQTQVHYVCLLDPTVLRLPPHSLRSPDRHASSLSPASGGQRNLSPSQWHTHLPRTPRFHSVDPHSYALGLPLRRQPSLAVPTCHTPRTLATASRTPQRGIPLGFPSFFHHFACCSTLVSSIRFHVLPDFDQSSQRNCSPAWYPTTFRVILICAPLRILVDAFAKSSHHTL